MPILPSWLIRIIYAALEVLAVLLIAWGWGVYQYHLGTKAQVAVQTKVELKTEVQATKLQGQLAGHLQTQYIYIQGATKTITEKVPVYVTKADDSKCSINNGFVSLWNSSNKMLPASAGSVGIEQPSDVSLSDVAAQHTKEAGICQATEAQRDTLKSYILGLQKLYSR